MKLTYPVHLVIKVSMPWMHTLCSTPTYPRMRNTQLVQDDCQLGSSPVAICLINLGAHMYIIFINVKILKLIKWSHRCPLIKLNNAPIMVNNFWACSPISYEHMSFFLASICRSRPKNISLKLSCLMNERISASTSSSGDFAWGSTVGIQGSSASNNGSIARAGALNWLWLGGRMPLGTSTSARIGDFNPGLV